MKYNCHKKILKIFSNNFIIFINLNKKILLIFKKKHHKKAIDRNLLKRLSREYIRLHKNKLSSIIIISRKSFIINKKKIFKILKFIFQLIYFYNKK
ncbi:Ribonuclease P protein component [Candidatus Johnevansia muelleri]|uniref:Ribonuclease P protein component n=1 Tax=Candidatus Johnevansia muelleri TaxID=1495769 RepID=A0A078KER5_9GAMM|nr:Ribonuclease P protein component [Candidatus Evansia muelleri]